MDIDSNPHINNGGPSTSSSPSSTAPAAAAQLPVTILTSRSFPGVSSSTRMGNVSWSEDGQCLFMTRKGVNIVTPHLATTLPPPATLVDPTVSLENPLHQLNESKRRAALASITDTGNGNGGLSDDDNQEGEGGGFLDEKDEDGEDDNAATAGKTGTGTGSGTKKLRRMRRPDNGEIRWWVTGIEVDKDGSRDDVYGWAEVGEESTAILREKEVTTRQAIWSPSNLSDIGGCLLVVLSSSMQVSVYAPRNDPYSKQWDEIADLTALTKALLPPQMTQPELTEQGMLELRTTALAWSSQPPVESMIGIDGSLLALSNRAAKLAFWSYGPQKRFKRLEVVDLRLRGGWITDIAWSQWKLEDERTCEAQLALSLTDGSIRLLHVRRSVAAYPDSDGSRSWKLEVSQPLMLDRGDKRIITSIKWIGDVLVWTKAGSVHLFADRDNQTVSWEGVRTLRLARVGNWASANGVGPCVGIHRINRDNLLIVLSSLTAHLITSFATSPTLAHPHESLKLTLGMRDVFVDQLMADPLIKARWRAAPIEPDGWTAHTAGWSEVGSWGNIGTWVTEPVNFHNLDSATEGKRAISLNVANLGKTAPAPDISFMEALQAVLDRPPRLIHISPGKVLLPYLLHLHSPAEGTAATSELLDLIKRPPPISPSATASNLSSSLWGETSLDSLRLRLVLAQWCIATFTDAAAEFKQASARVSAAIDRRLLIILIQWIGSLPEGPSNSGPTDRQFVSLLVKATKAFSDTDSNPAIQEVAHRLATQTRVLQSGGSNAEDNASSDERCPACKTEVAADGVCAKGHVWGE
ncbi:hypothetical protein I316_01473 [Kwoniella heveanensis BCC8398]|uniref:Transcription factor IIIC 90kDa subunit N-terminal domain-containing protein n=1 Tax=Kwoniella heveanensis BCC8398 TaxID=1296120 RepID=A0A1B9H0R7_9TREE|nr:hypothetical protein I316_01473 [Kwoniella heveanensis BCC8398]